MRAITQLRRERGFGGQDGINRLAKLCNLAPSTVATILGGRGACLGRALQLAKILDCDPLLFSGSQPKGRLQANKRQSSSTRPAGAATPKANVSVENSSESAPTQTE